MTIIFKSMFRPRAFAAYSAFWIALSCLLAVRSIMNHSLLGDPLSYTQALLSAAATSVFWMITLPGIAVLAERFPLSTEAWQKNLSLHTVFALSFILTYVIWRTALHVAVEPMRRLEGPVERVFQIYLFGSMGRSLLLYVGVVALVHAWQHYQDFKAERELSSKLQEQVAELLRDDDSPANTSAYAERFILKERGRVFAVRVSDLDWIEASGNYVTLHVGGKCHLLRETMRSMEQKLDSSRFLRVHRSAIVHLSRIREVRALGAGRYAAVLLTGTQVPLGQPGVERLERLLAQPQDLSPSKIRA
jgi:DNA-binding LytR/AlgR family response regulator